MPIISAECLSKRYPYKKSKLLREVKLKNPNESPLSVQSRMTGKGDFFWALKDVSFTVERGDVIGIIGRNGAGKSTLLSILAKITAPTEGFVKIKGKISCLLGLGIGFNTKLSGRENIYLNGAIHGLKKKEIDMKLEEIVDFSGLEEFIDVAMKHYSSGMFARLGFAVAAHLDPEILLLDEVFSAGDVEYQDKSFKKIQSLRQSGTTMIFTSHNTETIKTMTNKVLMLEQGRLIKQGVAEEVIGFYLNRSGPLKSQDNLAACNRTGNGKVWITSFRIEPEKGKPQDVILSGGDAVFCIGFTAHDQTVKNVSVGISFHTRDNRALALNYNHFQGVLFQDLPEKGYFRCRVTNFPFSPGEYVIRLRIMSGNEDLDWPDCVFQMKVEMGDFFCSKNNMGELVSWGPMLVQGKWECLAE